jgi:hypothetical protein
VSRKELEKTLLGPGFKIQVNSEAHPNQFLSLSPPVKQSGFINPAGLFNRAEGYGDQF